MKVRRVAGLRKGAIGAALILLAFLASTLPAAAEEPSSPSRVVPGRILVKPKAGVASSGLVAALGEEELALADQIPQLGYVSLAVPPGREWEWAQRLGQSPLVAHAQPEFRYRILDINPNDSIYNWARGDGTYYQWNLRRVRAPQGWDISTGSDQFLIGIVDTGVDDRHEDLNEKVASAIDYVNESDPYADQGGHGTLVAGIAAARTNNAKGVAGVSWGARLVSAKVADHSGKAKDTDAIKGIVYAADQGARVINLSLGGQEYSQALQDAVDYAYNKGALLIAAAGNCGDVFTYTNNGCTQHNPLIYPAAGNHTLAVGATDRFDRRASFSEYGSYLDVVAPGEGIVGPLPNQNYSLDGVKGTSMAAPHVSGLAALIWSVNPALTNDQVAQVLTSTATDLSPAGRDDEFGWGLINVQAALQTASSTTMAVTPDALSFLAKYPVTQVMTRTLTITTGSSIPWSATSVPSASWLSLNPTAGTGPATMTVLASLASLGVGQYQSAIKISAPSAQPPSQDVSVTLVLTDTIYQWNIPLAMLGRQGGW